MWTTRVESHQIVFENRTARDGLTASGFTLPCRHQVIKRYRTKRIAYRIARSQGIPV
jgi:hypothetical protein